ncbi:MAG: heat-inducible transcription repressor HrcA [Ruminococcaceae bacterium]|nr:heat-inducible transcription repressor HrcA [Oscillospiraceae bacterium]
MTKIELTPRKQAVLKAIVKAYIETGEPIGSKILTSLIENAPSSATLRNEMSELVSMGLLEQPHTSAGRIPTRDGLKLYISDLMQKTEISPEDKGFIDARFENLTEMPEKIPAKAGEILSDLTHLPVIACLISPDTAVIKKIELMHISRNTVMLLIVTSDSRTRNRIFRLPEDFTQDMLERFTEIAQTKIKGKHLEELSIGYMQSLVASLGIDAFGIMPLISSVFETISEIDNMSVDLSGVSRLYNVCGNEESARRIISLVESRDPIISLFERVGDGVVFGKDTGYSEFENDTLIAARFTSEKYKGYIALLGSDRISFERIIPVIEYTAQKLSKVIADAQKDMED